MEPTEEHMACVIRIVQRVVCQPDISNHRSFESMTYVRSARQYVEVRAHRQFITDTDSECGKVIERKCATFLGALAAIGLGAYGCAHETGCTGPKEG